VARSKHRIDVSGASAPLARPFEGLAELGVRLRVGPASRSDLPAEDSTCSPTDPVARASRLVVRRERKGHGGKTATRIEGLTASSDELHTLAGEIRRAFGCGAAVDDGDIVVQGEQSDRLVVFLGARGARKIVRGS
jgi:translation initiation factor 1 (eIF-1/SUI1)